MVYPADKQQFDPHMGGPAPVDKGNQTKAYEERLKQVVNAYMLKKGEVPKSNFDRVEQALHAYGRFYDPKQQQQNPLKAKPELKYSVRQSSSDPDSYAVGVVTPTGIKELGIKKADFIRMVNEMRGDQIVDVVQEKLNPLAPFEEQLRKIGRLYTPGQQNPLETKPGLKYSLRISTTDPDSYAIGILTPDGIKEVRMKKVAFFMMTQSMNGERIVEELSKLLSSKSGISAAVLQEVKASGDDSKERLKKVLEMKKEDGEVKELLQGSRDKESCKKLLEAILGVDSGDENKKQIKEQWKILVKQVHTDKQGDSAELIALLNEIWDRAGMK